MEFGHVKVERKAACVMRDGITLYADIYRPAEEGTYPVLLMRHPYGRKIASTVTYAHPVWYAARGYIVVIQDVRGRGDSEGEFTPFVSEAEDGYDTVEWAAGLEGASGKVGMYGFSYQGATQWAAASQHPPHLAAIAPAMTAADLYHGWMYTFGSFDLQSCLPWAYQLARDTARRKGDTEAEAACSRVMSDPSGVLAQLPLAQGHPLLEAYLPAYFDWLGHPAYDEYWSRLNWLDAFKEQPVPALHIAGWYDFLLEGTLQSYNALQAQESRPDCFHRLVVGPWTHIPWGRKAGGTDYGPKADGNIHLEQLAWFDYWLKGEGGSALKERQPVRYYEAGSGVWVEAEAYPAGVEGDSRWYLTGTRLPANGASGGGRLAADAGVEPGRAADVFVYDARLPMPLRSVLPQDRSAQQDRFEILVYTGEPAGAPLRILGAPEVTVSCQVMDGPTDLTAILTQVTPAGEARFLSVGRTEIGASGGISGWETVTIRMRPLAAELPAGSMLRLELSGSAYPLLLRHPNGIPLQEAASQGPDALQIATVAVDASGGASWLQLPILGDTSE
ncbi:MULTISPECIES: CocE/NonD family hydrolase [Paenibacillus]|nr:CocE/NonD family hydrolase [Paenibacillus rhizosphaerae]